MKAESPSTKSRRARKPKAAKHDVAVVSERYPKWLTAPDVGEMRSTIYRIEGLLAAAEDRAGRFHNGPDFHDLDLPSALGMAISEKAWPLCVVLGKLREELKRAEEFTGSFEYYLGEQRMAFLALENPKLAARIRASERKAAEASKAA